MARPDKETMMHPHDTGDTKHSWYHAPTHPAQAGVAWMITAGTFQKTHHFRSPERLDFLRDKLLELAEQTGWTLHAWAIFSNHYHFIAHADSQDVKLRKLMSKLHMITAKYVNERDAAPGRKVWFQYWDSALTYETSYLARLRYVHENPVRHGQVRVASEYPWCSARKFERDVDPAFRRRVVAMPQDRLEVPDDF